MIAEAGPTAIPVAIAALVAFALCVALVVLVSKMGAPGPSDVAVAYEYAWDRLDFATVWNLAGPRMRDGRTRAEFVRDKQGAYAVEGQLSGLVRSVRPEKVDVNGPVARVLTRLELADGNSVLDEVLLERIGANWQVASYSLADRKSG
jgi:hypothetical protein